MKEYSEAGLAFTIPKDMEKLSVNNYYADVAFRNDEGAEFFIYYYSREELLTRLYFADKDASSLVYIEWFTNMNGYTGVERTYDEENDYSGLDEFTVVTMSPDEKMEVSISVDETNILSLEPGQTATITVSSIGSDTYSGTGDDGSTEGVCIQIHRLNSYFVLIERCLRIFRAQK